MESSSEFDFAALPINVIYVRETTKDNDWECDHWSVSIGEGKSAFVTDYFTGLGHRKVKRGSFPPPRCGKNTIAYVEWEKANIVPVKPDNKSIVYSLLMDSDASDYNFNDWCDNLGYSSDSIQALNVYKQCLEIAENLRKVFSREVIQQMRVALEDY